MHEWTEEEMDKVVDDVMRRSMIDPEFRGLAVEYPRLAIAKVTQQPLPPEFSPRFLDSSIRSPAFILPEMIASEGELSDLELEAIAGGACVCTNCCISNCVFTNCTITIG